MRFDGGSARSGRRMSATAVLLTRTPELLGSVRRRGLRARREPLSPTGAPSGGRRPGSASWGRPRPGSGRLGRARRGDDPAVLSGHASATRRTEGGRAGLASPAKLVPIWVGSRGLLPYCRGQEGPVGLGGTRTDHATSSRRACGARSHVGDRVRGDRGCDRGARAPSVPARRPSCAGPALSPRLGGLLRQFQHSAPDLPKVAHLATMPF